MKILFELNNNVFKVNDYYVCISDENLKIGDYCINIDKLVIDVKIIHNLFTIFHINNDETLNTLKSCCKKIIFTTKFIDNSIPVINLIDYNSKSYKDIIMNPYPIGSEINNGYDKGFIDGYFIGHYDYIRSEKDIKYTENDIIKAILFGKSNDIDKLSYQNFIKSLEKV